MAEDRMLSDEILLGLIKKNGGGGGTTNYNLLENKPQIAGTELQGDKSLADLGIASAQSVSNITNGENINNFAGVENALEGKQDALTAGDYISIANDEISVDREIPSVIAEYEIKTEPMVEGQAFISVTKTVNGEVVLTQKYGSSTAGINQGINFDDNIYVDYSKTASWSWTYKLRNASVDHAANYTQSWNYGSTVDYTEEFVVTDHSGDKLVIKSEMDTALADKADTDMVAADFNAGTSYTAGNYCVQDGKLYKFKNNHSGAWSAADVDEVKITGELSSLKRGLNNVSKGKFINPYLESGEFAVYWNNYSATYANLDNIDVSGFGGVSDTDTNYPSDSDGWGSLVSFCCGGIRLQFYYSWNDSKLYFRSYLSITWTAWKNITMS